MKLAGELEYNCHAEGHGMAKVAQTHVMLQVLHRQGSQGERGILACWSSMLTD
jgi:hypothetical protein